MTEVEELQTETVPLDQALIAEMLEFGKVHYPDGSPYSRLEYRKWLYLDNPHGRACAPLIRARGRLVGQAVMVPVWFRLADGRRQLGRFVVDVLTHPDFRNQRLFSRIIESARNACAQENAWLLGHPNAAALKGWQRMGMQFKPDLAPNVLVPWPGLRGRWLRSPAGILQQWDDFMDRLSLQSDAPEIDRTPEYIEWRFCRCPDRKYRLGLFVDGHGLPLAWQSTTSWRKGLSLLVDHACIGRRPLSAGFGTLALLPPAGRDVVNALRLPVRKRIPFFLTSPRGEAVDCHRVTLAASDF